MMRFMMRTVHISSEFLIMNLIISFFLLLTDQPNHITVDFYLLKLVSGFDAQELLGFKMRFLSQFT